MADDTSNFKLATILDLQGVHVTLRDLGLGSVAGQIANRLGQVHVVKRIQWLQYNST